MVDASLQPILGRVPRLLLGLLVLEELLHFLMPRLLDRGLGRCGLLLREVEVQVTQPADERVSGRRIVGGLWLRVAEYISCSLHLSRLAVMWRLIIAATEVEAVEASVRLLLSRFIRRRNSEIVKSAIARHVLLFDFFIGAEFVGRVLVLPSAAAEVQVHISIITRILLHWLMLAGRLHRCGVMKLLLLCKRLLDADLLVLLRLPHRRLFCHLNLSPLIIIVLEVQLIALDFLIHVLLLR